MQTSNISYLVEVYDTRHGYAPYKTKCLQENRLKQLCGNLHVPNTKTKLRVFSGAKCSFFLSYLQMY